MKLPQEWQRNTNNVLLRGNYGGKGEGKTIRLRAGFAGVYVGHGLETRATRSLIKFEVERETRRGKFKKRNRATAR